MRWDKTATLITVLLVISIACGIPFAGHGHFAFSFQHLPVYYGLLGIIGSAAMIIIAKPIFGRILERPADYYQGGDKKND